MDNLIGNATLSIKHHIIYGSLSILVTQKRILRHVNLSFSMVDGRYHECYYYGKGNILMYTFKLKGGTHIFTVGL